MILSYPFVYHDRSPYDASRSKKRQHGVVVVVFIQCVVVQSSEFST